MDVNIEPGGMPRELFVDSLDIWSRLVGEFNAENLLAVLGAELDVIQAGQSGNLDELRRERAQAQGPGGERP